MTQVTELQSKSASALRALKCKECGEEYELKAMHVCEFCFGPLKWRMTMTNYGDRLLAKVFRPDLILFGGIVLFAYHYESAN